MIIWTIRPNPMRLGGRQGDLVGVEAGKGTVGVLGKGIVGRVFTTPWGKTLVTEAASGAIIGTSLARVKRDIKEGDLDLMRQQVAQAMRDSQLVVLIPEEEFWSTWDK